LENQEQEKVLKQNFEEKYKLTHISTGDVFRFNLKNDTDLGKQARVYMDAGDLVPDELTTKMLIDEVNKHPDTNGILFDGYPRTLSQAIALDAFMISIDSKVTATIALEADDEILIQRLLERGKQVVELMIKMKIKSEIATRNTMRNSSFNAVLQ
jgi:adenylate kinase